MKTKRSAKLRLFSLGLLVIVSLPLSTLFRQANAQAPVIQAYSTTSPLQNGTIVQLQSHKSDNVIPLTEANDIDMFGVVVSPSASSFNLSPSSATASQAYVATSGDYQALVNNQNGPISIGDYVTISAISGIGMKADDSEQLILGKAVSSFNGSNALSTTTLKNSNGSTKNVSIGLIEVSIDIAHNPLIVSVQGDLPNFLQKASKGVTNKSVSTAKLVLAIVMLGITTILAGILLYSGVKNTIVAIGRNPLSRKFVVRGLIQVTIIAIIVFLVGIFGVYLLLIL